MSKSSELVSLDAVESASPPIASEAKVEVTHDLSKDAPSAADFSTTTTSSCCSDFSTCCSAADYSMTATWSQMFSCATGLDYVLMFFGTVGGLITGISIPFFNVLFGKMLDALNTDPTSFSDRIKAIALAFVGVAAINVVSGIMQIACWSHTGERQSQKFRERYVKAILSQEIGWFDTIGAAELSTKVADLTGKVQDGMTRKVGDLIQYFGQFCAAFVVGLYLCWQLTVVLLAAFPLIGGAGFFMITAITEAQNKAGENYASAGGLATEALGAIRTVTALNSQPDLISRYRVFLLDAMKVGITKGMKVGMGNGAVFGAAFCTYALGFWYGGKLVADSLDANCDPYAPTGSKNACFTGGTILAVFFSVIMGSIALGQLVPPLAAFFSAKAAVHPIMEVVERKPLIDGFSDEGTKPKEKTKGRIELKNIMFAYPSRPNINVCNNYCLTVEPGEIVALVGASGSGKSTIVNLLLRFYDPQSGVVAIDGHDIKTLNCRWLRSQLGLVSQEPVLFSGTVEDNIAYGIDSTLEHGVTKPANGPRSAEIKERIIAAAKLANAHEFISAFPNGYDTDVGSGGIAMSGGQKQRIAIARALVKKPSILLLDEATSALDATSERLVQQSIDDLQKSKTQTTLVIAHRLSTIRNADKICVVNQGAIAEMGTHDELIAKNGLYADLVRLQMTGEDDEDAEVEAGAAGEGDANKSSAEAPGRKQSDAKVDDVKLEGDEKPAADAAASSCCAPKAPKSETELLEEKESKELMSKVWGLIRRHPLWMLGALIGAGAFGAIFPCWGLLLGKTQNMFYYTDTNKIRQKAAELAGYYILLAVIAVVSSTLQFWGSAQVCERVSMRLRSDYFEAILRREIAFFDADENQIGTLTTRLSDDSRAVTKATGEAIPRQLQAIFTLAIGLGIGLSACWKLALVVLATFPVNIAASAIQMQAIAGQQYGNEKDVNPSGAIISSAFNHMRTVTAFSMQFKVSDEYAFYSRKASEDRMGRSWMAGFGFGGANCSLFCTYALLFWYGAQLISNNDVTFENMMISILSLMLGALGLGQALTDLGDQTEGVQATKRIFRMVEQGEASPIDGLSKKGLRPDARPKGKIELTNVNFRYPTRPNVEVCKNYNLTIEPGEVVALVGPSGSGKSTIINLLMRFYDPLNGSVKLDGVDTKDLNVRWLRSQIGFVGQEPVLFSGSIASNIAKGRQEHGSKPLLTLEEVMALSDRSAYVGKSNDGATTPGLDPKSADADIITASESSNAHEFISKFTEGYGTDVGEGSIMVSGGQKQRIAIARALVKKPAVLLLDEATSALDSASERMVQESIDELQRNKTQTTIVIAHRLSTIRNADKICVIDKGVVVQIGTHDQLLLDEQGLYLSLWKKQSGMKKNMSSGNNLAELASK